jgi:hypothetical protein
VIEDPAPPTVAVTVYGNETLLIAFVVPVNTVFIHMKLEIWGSPKFVQVIVPERFTVASLFIFAAV